MTSRICVYGLWHLGCVTAACLAEAGFEVVALDPDSDRIEAIRGGRPPISEPGLNELIQAGVKQGKLHLTSDPAEAVVESDVLWTTFDTPVDEMDRSNPDWVRAQLDRVHTYVRPGMLVIISSQVPVGFGACLERDWNASSPPVHVACVPENLRLGQALATFRSPERVVVGTSSAVDRPRLMELLEPFTSRIEWMSVGSAEMTKQALNAYLAMSVAYTNELARLCEQLGADVREVERGLRTDHRIGPYAYVTPGAPFAGGTLARDVTGVSELARTHQMPSPIFDAVLASNRLHGQWARERVLDLLRGVDHPRVALLGLTYKPGTDTLQRSATVELGRWLTAREIDVRAYDPAIRESSDELGCIQLADGVADALGGADVAIVGTNWPEFRDITADFLIHSMRRPVVVDLAGFLADVEHDPRVTYVRVGKPRTGWTHAS